MIILQILETKFLNVFLVLVQARSSFGVYSVSKSLTPFGWFFVISLIILAICGIIYLKSKTLKKPKLK